MSKEKAKRPQGPMLHWRGGFLASSFVVSVGEVIRTAMSRGWPLGMLEAVIL